MYKPCTEGVSVLPEIEFPKLEDSAALALDVAAVKFGNNRVYLFVVSRALENFSLRNIIRFVLSNIFILSSFIFLLV